MAHISQDFVEAYVTLGGNREQLLTLYHQARDSGDGTDRSSSTDSLQMLNVNSPPEELAKCYKLEMAEDTYHLGSTGAVQLVTNIVQVRAVAQPVRFFPIFANYENDERPGVLTVEEGMGCRIARLEENSKGHVLGILELDEMLMSRDSDPYTFSYSVHVHSDVPCSPFIRNHVRNRLARHALRVRFVEPAVPTVLWWFRGVHHTDVEVAQNKDRIMEVAGDNFYFHDFYDLQQEYWGIAWNWDFSV